MDSLRRHRLAFVSDEGWATLLDRPWDAQARDCLMHWSLHRLPLVVTRQSFDAEAFIASLAFGLPAPERWGRRRLALQLPRGYVTRFDEFPRLANVVSSLPVAARDAASNLVGALAACGAGAHVYGSFGWQALTGLDHVRSGSDLDLWVPVGDEANADVVAGHLRKWALDRPRLDGELVFADGAAVAWREWIEWRAGRARAVLVKGVTGAELRRDGACFATTGLPATIAA